MPCSVDPRAVLWREALSRGAVDGVFIARPDGDNLKGDVVELAVDQPEPLRTLTRHVELDSGEPGQVAADVSVAQLFADGSAGARRHGPDAVGLRLDPARLLPARGAFPTRPQAQ